MPTPRRRRPVPKPGAPLPKSVRAALRWLAARAASAGGKARWKGVSAAERTAHAKRAVAARESKRRNRNYAPEGLVVPRHRYKFNARTRAALAVVSPIDLTSTPPSVKKAVAARKGTRRGKGKKR